MGARSAGIPGLGVTLAAAGGYLVFAGIRNVPLKDGMKEILRGNLPAGRPSQPTELPAELQPGSAANRPAYLNVLGGSGSGSTGGGGLGAQIATEARAHLGVPYVWGGATPAGWDCSGLVTWVLVKVGAGDALPSKVHTVTGQFLLWNGATTVPRSQCQAGDLACWAGHIGIAVDRDQMVNAPTFGIPTRISAIYGGVTIRRVRGA